MSLALWQKEETTSTITITHFPPTQFWPKCLAEKARFLVQNTKWFRKGAAEQNKRAAFHAVEQKQKNIAESRYLQQYAPMHIGTLLY